MIIESILISVLTATKVSNALSIPGGVSNANALAEHENGLNSKAEHQTLETSNQPQGEANALGFNDIPYLTDILNFFHENSPKAAEVINEYGDNDGKYFSDDSDCDDDGDEEDDDDDDEPISEMSVSDSSSSTPGESAESESKSGTTSNESEVSLENQNPTFNASFAAGIFVDIWEDEEEDCGKWFWPFNASDPNSANSSQALDPAFIQQLHDANKHPVPNSKLVRQDAVVHHGADGSKSLAPKKLSTQKQFVKKTPTSNDIKDNTGKKAYSNNNKESQARSDKSASGSLVDQKTESAALRIPFFGGKKSSKNADSEASDVNGSQDSEDANSESEDSKYNYFDPDNVYQTNIDSQEISSLSFDFNHSKNDSSNFSSSSQAPLFNQYQDECESSAIITTFWSQWEMTFMIMVLAGIFIGW